MRFYDHSSCFAAVAFDSQPQLPQLECYRLTFQSERDSIECKALRNLRCFLWLTERRSCEFCSNTSGGLFCGACHNVVRGSRPIPPNRDGALQKCEWRYRQMHEPDLPVVFRNGFYDSHEGSFHWPPNPIRFGRISFFGSRCSQLE